MNKKPDGNPLQANAIGRSAKTVREFLEKHYTDEVAGSQEECIKLALKALLEVVQSGAKNVELAVMRGNEALKVRHWYMYHQCSPQRVFARLEVQTRR